MSGQRCVIVARIIGALHRESPKLKMFMISVSWSDQSEVIVYRSFQDFKRFHRQLKKRFPTLNPFQKSNRMIPKFKRKAIKSGLPQKGSSRSVLQMRFLESYCAKLLKCDLTVTQSSEVTQFFTPKDHDLQPDFTKNSVMLMLSEDASNGSAGGGGDGAQQYVGSVTHPFVTQTYCCVAAYETKDTKNRPFKAALNEKLDVLIKDPAGWWLVENEEKRLAWFPAPYLELWDMEEDEDQGFQQGGSLYCAVRTFSTKKADEVSVAIGSVVEVLRKSDDGWWLIRFNGKVGHVPSMYLQPYNNPRAGLYSLQRKLHSSTLTLSETGSSYPPSGDKESKLRRQSEADVKAFLHKAQSLDVLSETRPETPLPAHTERDDNPSDSRFRKMSTDSSFSTYSGSSSCSFEELDQLQASSSSSGFSSSGASSLDLSLSSMSSASSLSARPKTSLGAAGAPMVPPRPKTEEILTRCTTMTRKVAMATKMRIQPQDESIQSR